eukprot:CAMPEP_0180530230 /NCGR_PEP_ID=MMETSP1036_2-20121128/61811_1 /TAXON_ID=632150 /ORGANISM="Azadinium spinosum, Strain 3D9" /LENGTH=192 /DNA_ID=CAMNT_0022544023 /DNA_START=32 /DNA_END=606 /DNA_ORIENTATION=+
MAPPPEAAALNGMSEVMAEARGSTSPPTPIVEVAPVAVVAEHLVAVAATPPKVAVVSPALAAAAIVSTGGESPEVTQVMQRRPAMAVGGDERSCLHRDVARPVQVTVPAATQGHNGAARPETPPSSESVRRDNGDGVGSGRQRVSSPEQREKCTASTAAVPSRREFRQLPLGGMKGGHLRWSDLGLGEAGRL